MSSPRHRLDVLLEKAQRLCRLDSSAARDVVATTREFIEAQEVQSQFPITTLYCNWSLHPRISRSLTALRCLGDITKELRTHFAQGANVDGFLQFLSEEVFQVHSLRRELLALTRDHGLSQYLYSSDHNWAVFVALLLESLVGKQIQYPPGADCPSSPSDPAVLRKAKGLYQDLFNATNGVRCQMFRAAWITLSIDPWDNRPEPDRKPVFHCNIQPFDGPTFVIRITNVITLPEADAHALFN